MDGQTDFLNTEGSQDPLNEILIASVTQKASDVHFEPEQDTLKVRFRIDGLLQEYKKLDKFTQDNLLSRIKVLSKMDITDHRLPQDGHFEFLYQGTTYNIRTSTLPTVYGENIVLRVLNRGDSLVSLDTIGLEPEQLMLIRTLIATPSGMLLCTGPTGSGKTTILYSILTELNKPNRNIVTLEDPVELQMANIRQVQINEAINLTFAKAMRSILRQDPDVIMVGEIRDTETAQMAIQASLIGMLVLSTFHTFDVPALVVRFMEQGISASVVTQAVRGVLSTRLVRRICDNCKEPYTLTEEEKRMVPPNVNGNFMHGRGCTACLNSGYLGRTGIFEIVAFDEDIRSYIIAQRTSDLYKVLQLKKTKTLRDAGMQKVLRGETTISELLRVLGPVPVMNIPQM